MYWVEYRDVENCKPLDLYLNQNRLCLMRIAACQKWNSASKTQESSQNLSSVTIHLWSCTPSRSIIGHQGVCTKQASRRQGGQCSSRGEIRALTRYVYMHIMAHVFRHMRTMLILQPWITPLHKEWCVHHQYVYWKDWYRPFSRMMRPRDDDIILSGGEQAQSDITLFDLQQGVLHVSFALPRDIINLWVSITSGWFVKRVISN